VPHEQQLIARARDQPSLLRSAFDSGRLSPRPPRVATAMIAPASTTIPSMITNTSNCGRSTTATRPVEFTMALCMAWKSPAINTLEPALL
jgi:hypothetical protein